MRAVLLLCSMVVTTQACAPPDEERPDAGQTPDAGEPEPIPGPTDPDPDLSTLQAAPLEALAADGLAAFSITAHVVDASGTPLAGMRVSFFTTRGTASTEALTDAEGNAVGTISSTSEGVATVSAKATTPADLTFSLHASTVVEFSGCRTLEQSYAAELYPVVFSRCQGCHNELGLARQEGLEFKLPFPGVDDWAARSLDVLRPLALADEPDLDGNIGPRLLLKPTDLHEEGHDGGEVLKPDSDEARMLQAFIARIRDEGACAGVERVDRVLAAIENLSPRDTWGRARAALLGEPSTQAELTAMPDTEQELAARIDSMLNDARALGRITDMYADWLLTDRFLYAVEGDKILNRINQWDLRFFYSREGDGPRDCHPATGDCCREFYSADYCDAAEPQVVDALAREPLDILREIVRTDRPISEAITLDHTLLNPYDATFYGFTAQERGALFNDSPEDDAQELVSARVHKTPYNKLGYSGAGVELPHAGLLTTHATLARWGSTTSNKNRGRAASVILRRLLDVDVTKFAAFSTASLDPDADLELATQDEVACTACHAAIDPLAGLYQHFTGDGRFDVLPRPAYLENMPTASFLDAVPAEGEDPLQFMAAQVVNHERFPRAMMMPVVQSLTGVVPLSPALDPRDPDLVAKSLALEVQNRLLTDLRQRFADADGLRVKALVKDVLLSPLFRAGAVDQAALSPVELAALKAAGIGVRTRLMTPEQLDRKVRAVFGHAYLQNRNTETGKNLLLSYTDYRVLFGGINFFTISTRFRDPTPIAARIVERMGNELACVTVRDELALPSEQRRLLGGASLTAEDDATIKPVLRALHRVLLGETLDDDSPELLATWQLFVDALAANRAAAAALPDGQRLLDVVCRPNGGGGASDAIAQTWLDTLTYLITDPRFFLE